VAKAILNLSFTKSLIDRLKVDIVLRRICGFNSLKSLPCEATFSNAFAEFSNSQILLHIHEVMIKDTIGDKVFKELCIDSTAIESREKTYKNIAKKTENNDVEKYKRGRPKKGEIRPAKEISRLEKQTTMTLEEMLDELPKECAKGCKKNSQGYGNFWKGYKLHIAATFCGIITACVLTSASVHDSGVIIPLEEITSRRIKTECTLADSAYDAKIIKSYHESKNKSSIIAQNKRGGKEIEKSEEDKEKYKARSSIERINSEIKDGFNARNIMVKGHSKVLCHLMFGVISLSAKKILYIDVN